MDALKRRRQAAFAPNVDAESALAPVFLDFNQTKVPFQNHKGSKWL
jgi:hypothetical protein